MEKQTDNTKFIISRFDNYISQANVKGNFLLAFNTFMIGGIITNHSNIIRFVEGEVNVIVINVMLALLFLASLATAFFVIKAVYPFLQSNNSSKNGYHSRIFFQSVSEFEGSEEYFSSLTKMTDKEFDNDLANQAYILSKGLRRKYCNLKYAMSIIYIEMVIIALILILILFL